jgi:putative ABC transport system permease protein
MNPPELMHGFLASVRYSLRLLLKSPGFTITAVLVLGLGIGANTAIFSLIDTVLLSPLAYPEPDRLVTVLTPNPAQNIYYGSLDYPDFLDFCRAQHSFVSLAAQHWDYIALGYGGRTEQVKVTFATASAFRTYGLPFVLGRPFAPEEDQPGGPLVAVLTEPFWRNRFKADPNILGKNIILGGAGFQVVGVIKAIETESREPTKVLIPLNTADVIPTWDTWRSRDNRFLSVWGRLNQGVTLAQAEADLQVIADNLAARYPEDKGYGVHVVSTQQIQVSDYVSTLWILGAAAAFLLLLSGINVATLIVARASDRQRDLTIRAAMGASRFRLINHLILESALLSFLGGLVGIPIALVAIEFIKRVSPADLVRVPDLSLSSQALLFCGGAMSLTALLSGLFPAFVSSKTDVATVLRSAGSRNRTAGPQRTRTQSLMMTGQVALACVLLIGTGLLVRSFEAAQNIPLGFNPQNLLAAEIELVNSNYKEQSKADAFFKAILEKVSQVPGVTAAALSDDPPFVYSEYGGYAPFSVPGRTQVEQGHEPTLNAQMISPGYFHALEAPILEGRDFGDGDNRKTQGVIIVNRTLADTFFPGQSAIGKQIDVPGSYMSQTRYTIVGVVQDARHGGPNNSPKFAAYFPCYQQFTHSEILFVRSVGDPSGLLPALRQAIASIDPEVSFGRVDNFSNFISQRFSTRKLAALLVSIFSGSALILAAVGLYGVLAYSVTRQTPEIGVRIAVGALRRHIVNHILKQGFKIVGIGVVAGVLTASVLSPFLGSLLYGVSGSDPITIAASIAVLFFATLLACLLPALRAVRINPVTALRE